MKVKYDQISKNVLEKKILFAQKNSLSFSQYFYKKMYDVKGYFRLLKMRILRERSAMSKKSTSMYSMRLRILVLLKLRDIYIGEGGERWNS